MIYLFLDPPRLTESYTNKNLLDYLISKMAQSNDQILKKNTFLFNKII